MFLVLLSVHSNLVKYSLGSGLKPDTQAYVLDATKNAISQISQVLANSKNITSLAFFTHGSEASLQLGQINLNSATLSQHREELKNWSKALASEADILFYGCNVAAGKEGKAFVRQLMS